MLLYIFKDGTARNVTENPSVADIVAVTQGLLKIFKFEENKTRFLSLMKDENSLEWVPVKESKTITNKDGRIHL